MANTITALHGGSPLEILKLYGNDIYALECTFDGTDNNEELLDPGADHGAMLCGIVFSDTTTPTIKFVSDDGTTETDITGDIDLAANQGLLDKIQPTGICTQKGNKLQMHSSAAFVCTVYVCKTKEINIK